MIAVYLAMLETDVDRDKFMKLYESYEKKLFAVALRILENNEKAEDAVQQAWLRIIQHWERVSCLEWDLAGGYAVTTVKNAAIDILRQEKRVEPLPATWDPPAREESQDEYQYLVSLIQTLPDTYRRILELKYVEEYSNREIAKRLKMNEATVATRARRGKMMLRERLDKEGFYEGLWSSNISIIISAKANLRVALFPQINSGEEGYFPILPPDGTDFCCRSKITSAAGCRSPF